MMNQFSGYQRDVELKMYQEKIIEYARMSDDEFSLHYIKVNAKYEKRLAVLSAISLILTFSIVFGIWRHLFMLLIKVADIKDSIPLTYEKFIIVCILFITIIVIALIIVFSILYKQIKDLQSITQERYFLEDVKLRRMYPHSSIGI